MRDVVYILKNDIDSINNDELRYSLRSVEKNFLYNRIWFYGGCPDWVDTENHIAFQQQGLNKWAKSTSTLRAICENDAITEEFYLFNDDFFILKPYSQDVAIVNGSIYERAASLRSRRGESKYYKKLMAEAKWLDAHGESVLNYATHTPLLVNREKALIVLNEVDSQYLFRNVYGNISKTPYIIHDDVKIFNDDFTSVPNGDAFLCSTGDKNFRTGAVGTYIRKLFPDPCKYEKGLR